MKAIVIEGGKGPAEALQLGEIDDPRPAPGQIPPSYLQPSIGRRTLPP